MSDTSNTTGADGIPENTSAPAGDDVRDEVRLDLDEASLDTWDEVRGDYALDPDADVARPALTEEEDDDENDVAPASGDDEEDTEAQDDDGESPEEE